MPFASITPEGSKAYVAAVAACLQKINTILDGRILQRQLGTLGKAKTIEDTEAGNGCRAYTDDTCPPLTYAIYNDEENQFARELGYAISRAARSGRPLEHFARQLSIGMTPVTYKAKKNVTRKVVIPDGMYKATADKVKEETARVIELLKELAAGTVELSEMPWRWRSQIPRLFREFLVPAVGGESRIYFNPVRPLYCRNDPAMHLRPPEIGLCHELIHALHDSQGRSMALVLTEGIDQNLEELITTGIPPYHFEEISDNKMRTQWPDKRLEIRFRYGS